jgi:hypothetical protein
MPCYKQTTFAGPYNALLLNKDGYASEAECLEACKDGACCETVGMLRGACNIKPQCQCQGAGQVFSGIGTACSPNPCNPLP